MPVLSDGERARLARSAAFASIAMALFLAGLKGWAVWRTGSTAMLGSLADTGLDLVASLATLAGVWVAAMPADEDHRFGHGKAEALSAMFQVILIVLSGAAIAVRAIVQLIEGGRVEVRVHQQRLVVPLPDLAAPERLLKRRVQPVLEEGPSWPRHVAQLPISNSP